MKVYKVFPPTLPEGAERVAFTADVGGTPFKFHLYWDTDKWRGYVVIPDLPIREVGVIPNVINWSRYLDYSVIFYSEYTDIDQSNISLCVVYIIVK